MNNNINNNLSDNENISAMDKVNRAIDNLKEERTDTLDNENRIKVLSPGMLVFKRFLRNKLAITGLIILVIMFLFAFVGPLFTSYSQTQVFTKVDIVNRDYASATINTELRATLVEGMSFSRTANAKFVLSINKGDSSFADGEDNYTIIEEGKDFYRLKMADTVASIKTIKGRLMYPKNDDTMSPQFKETFEQAYDADLDTFQFENQEYIITREKSKVDIGLSGDVAIMSMLSFNADSLENEDLIDSFDFRLAAEKAINGNMLFSVDNRSFIVEGENDDYTIYENLNGEKSIIAITSKLIVNPVNSKAFLPLSFVMAFRESIENEISIFELPDIDNPEENIEYRLSRNNANYIVTSEQEMHITDMYAAPTAQHLLGTDEKAMDMFTRLMHGGRISLLVGFVVVFLEIIIGVLFGGISGYFGGWLDTLLMRFVDLFNCIPYWPIMIIAGSVMDMLEVPSTTRIFLLMFIMGLMGWTGIARIVRGQILMLREQDFMIATEATGLSVRKRIFRHLVPNVMPLLIVQATLSLGGIIITEATLSFLGLGVKPPLASWGSIINAANNIYVMRNCWWVWLPTGFLIVITVLGFNFVGDGLRDAFDPKMKR